MDYVQTTILILIGAILGSFASVMVPKVLKAVFKTKTFKATAETESEIEKFEDFANFEARFAYHHYRHVARAWEDRGKSLSGFSGVLLTLIVATTMQFLRGAEYWLNLMALISGLCFLLAALTSSLYVVFPRGALFITAMDSIAYLRNKAETLDKTITSAFAFFILGTIFTFILLVSVIFS